jgi:lipopolysaccharide/colanic/teichoic acid biosynthesis glycosyltransferase
VTLAAIALVPAALIVLAAALVHLLFHGPPVLFRQERVGLAGRPIVVLKLRTMGLAAGAAGNAPAARKITAVGGILRRLAIDELPQLLNVLRGDMSLVGPRPTLPYQIQRYDGRQILRLSVLPGLTGLAQVHGRQRMSWPERIEWDLRYAEQQSLRLDVAVLFLTAWTVLAVGGAAASHENDPIARIERSKGNSA